MTQNRTSQAVEELEHCGTCSPCPWKGEVGIPHDEMFPAIAQKYRRHETVLRRLSAEGAKADKKGLNEMRFLLGEALEQGQRHPFSFRHVVPCPALKLSACLLLVEPSPLLEEEARLRDGTDHGFPWPTFPAFGRAPGPDSPPTIAQWIPLRFRLDSGPSSGSSERNFVMSRGLSQVVDAECVLLVLHAHAHPDLRPPIKNPVKFQNSIRAFRQYLVCVPVRLLHHVENSQDVLQRARPCETDRTWSSRRSSAAFSTAEERRVCGAEVSA